ncbi:MULTISPECIES: lycopene cyclase domain-containing protein [unclassified Microbacterium]|uniref:lycopene cyclase domain-containing protein n=1 Tax=unclassified Microbacterium TaxID=2609290 RepID=UPI0037451652
MTGVPGLYLLALLISAFGIITLDVRWRLVVRDAPWRTLFAVLIGTAFFLVWDLVNIALNVFTKGDSPYLLGIDLAPHLPLEEPFFLAFLCYLSLVAWAATERVLQRRSQPEDAA